MAYYIVTNKKHGPYSASEALAEASRFVYVAAKHRTAVREMKAGQSVFIVYGYTSVEVIKE